MAFESPDGYGFDHAPEAVRRTWKPHATIAIIIVNVAVFALEYLGPLNLARLIDAQALSTSVVRTGAWYTLLTSMFLHGSVTHILCNMVTLYWVGALLENVYGALRFTVLYFAAGIAGGLAFVGINILLGTRASAVGASGAIFGLFAAYAYLLVREHRRACLFVQPVSRADVTSFLSVIGINVLVSLTPGIAWEAHFGGFAGGLVVGALMYEGARRALEKRIGSPLR